MHPILFRIGSFPIGTYGLLLAVGFFAALALAVRLGRTDGLSKDAVSDLAITVLIAGLVGSRLLMILVGLMTPAGEAGAMTLRQAFSFETLRAGGAVHGGIIAGTAAFFWRVRALKLPLAPTMDVLAPAVALGQAIGRLGCFAAGCCYGTTCSHPWGVTFTDPDAYLLSGTPLDHPIHPVQLYNSLSNLAILGILLLVRKHRRFPAQVFSAYFVLEGLGRFTLEAFRGDLDRGVWLGLSWLSTGRLTALAFMLAGAFSWFWFGRRKPTPSKVP